ncbi:hypothetical protein ETD86_23200 [Nonomuraea turkmeniaca]|uniref:Uncharacterized protein n=2 Tax=Nonomuraea turkmeniaca TaxID=103838 RepID=A0A5S4FF13_9ACTN|nr:hypothetical protein ETD86_23200 [Nonomuraea turkmeniaca]
MRPRRGRCGACRATHVLLPVTVLLRRADAAVVIGAALVAKAAGAGHRRIAARLDRPSATVRGWLRAFARAAEAIRAYFAVVLVGLAADPVLPQASGDVSADVVAVIAAVADAAGRRWPQMGTVSPWLVASAATAGCLIHPSGPAMWIKTSHPWAGWM